MPSSSKRDDQNVRGWKIGSGCWFWVLVREGAPSLKDSGQSDIRFSTEQEGKFLYAARTKRGHRFGGVPTTPKGRDLFLLVLIFG